MHLFKRGDVYWFQLIVDGRRIRKSTKTANRRAAGDIASAFRVELAKGNVGIETRKKAPVFSAAMKDFLDWSQAEHKAHPRTASRSKVSSAALKRFFRDTVIDKITPDDVERFKVSRANDTSPRTQRKVRPATVNRELACLREMFNYAMKADLVLRNPVSRVKFLAEQNEQDRVLNFAEQNRYFDCATPALRDVATLILETGMRPEEVYTLQVSSVDTVSGFLQVQRGKTAAAKRRIKLTSAARRVLEARLAIGAASPYVFPCETDLGRPMPKINNAHDRALRDSGVDKFRLYDLRHTFATRAAEAGVDPVTLAAMLGHSRLQMVMRYAHPTQAHQSSAMDLIERHNAAKEQAERKPEIPAANGPQLVRRRG